MRRTSKTPSTLSESLHRQLNSYALAASAAGVSLVALARSADARIVYTPTHQVVKPNDHYNLDLNKDGIADFIISNIFSCGHPCADTLTVNPIHHGSKHYNSVIVRGVMLSARALRKGTTIGARQIFSYSAAGMANAGFLSSGTFTSGGLWAKRGRSMHASDVRRDSRRRIRL